MFVAFVQATPRFYRAEFADAISSSFCATIGSTSPELPQSGVAESQRLVRSHVAAVARTSGRLFSLKSGRSTGTTAPSNFDSRPSDLEFLNFD
jgi:hypothetical protein